jgi:hypothetical protein
MTMKRIRLKVDGTVAEAVLHQDHAPRTVAALWEHLPIADRAIQTRWSGNAWRTEGNHELLPDGAEVENVKERLAAGDVIYYPNYDIGLVKFAVAYGDAQWLGPFMLPRTVAHIGTVDRNLEGLIAASKRLLYDGALPVEIERVA